MGLTRGVNRAQLILESTLRALASLCSILAYSAAFAAEPVFVPPFTYATSDEFAVAVMLDSMTQDQLLARGHVVLGGQVVAPVVGDAAISQCADLPSCPGDLLPRLPVSAAVVARIARSSGGLLGHVEVWPADGGQVESLDLPIAAGSEHLFAAAVVEAVDAALRRMPPSPEDRLMLAARMIAGELVDLAPPAATPVTAEVLTGNAPPTDVVDLDAPSRRPPASSVAGKLPEGVAPRHLAGSEGHFRKSGLDARDWLYRAMPHAGRFTFEVRAGIGIGDVDRFSDVRVDVDGGAQRGQYYQEGPASARRARGAIFLGYAPLTYLDVGVLVGLQYGGRDLTTGFVRVAEDGSTQATVSPAPEIQAVQVAVQPRVRGYLAPVGPAKPFVFTGMEFRVFDAYNIEQPETLVYPVPQGGTVPGWVGGGGLMIDPGPIVGLFFEASYTAHFGDRSRVYEDGTWQYDIPTPEEGAGYTVGLAGGVQFRL